MNDPFERFQQESAVYWDQVRRDNGVPIPSRADDRQVEGSHYKDMGVQPWSVMQAVLTYDEFVGYLKGNIIKYGMRQGLKTEGDAAKAQHYIDKLQEVEGGRLGY